MSSEKFAEIINYLIGVGLMVALVFIFKTNKSIPEKKAIGFPIIKVIYAVIVFFLLMIIWTFIK